MAAPHLCPRALARHTTHLSHPSTHHRLFTTTAPCLARPHKTNPLSLLPPTAPSPPPYPYPRRTQYKQADHGLYGGATIQFGNNVSTRNEIKTRRVWRPNTQYKHLYSAALARTLRLRVSTRVLRTIDKAGGLDNYLLGTGAQRVKELGEEGWKLRWAILQSEAVRGQMGGSETLRRMVQGTGEGSWEAEAAAVGGEGEGEEAGLEVVKEDDVAEGGVERVEEADGAFMRETQASQPR